jgi:hypothetical protein
LWFKSDVRPAHFAISFKGFIVVKPMASETLQRLSSATTKDQSFSDMRLKAPRCNASRALSPYILPYFIILFKDQIRNNICPFFFMEKLYQR